MTVAERPTEPLHRRLGVTDDELDAIRDRLGGRDPNDLELAMFSVMWSEHCSYKSSKPLLRTLPTEGEGVVAGPGENAGVISIGDGLAVAFKIESHNHPSAVEPYQGAATGVGGILRDIFTMGARPIAVLDALRFGDPADARTRHLVDGVVRGVGGYGNCVGVPTVGGELVFDPSYGGNPLVNVMAIGLLEERRLTLAAAPGPGNLVVLYGSATGRDGIGGASVLASATFTDDDPSKRPSVQVGDPFAEKLLIEASLELIERGLVEGLQDLGAGGITCATSETADRAGTGIVVDLDAIPRREPGLAPFEVMISESQERMCAAVLPERWDDVREVCERWGLPVAIIGRVTDDGDIAIVEGGLDADGRPAAGAREIARIPAAALTSDAIVHARVASAPTHRRGAPAPGAPAMVSDRLPERGMDPGAVLLGLLGSANLASRHAVYHQYDSTVGADTVAGPGRGAAVLRVKGTTRGARRHDGRQPVGRGVRSVAGRGAVGRGGDAQRLDHRRPAAGRDQLPQLRRPHPARGVLAAERGRARAGGRVPRAGPAGHRRQRLPVQRVTGRRDRPDARHRRRRPARRHRDARRAGLRPDPRRGPAGRRDGSGPGRIGLRGAGRRRDGGRPADARPRPRGGGPGVRARGDRSRARRLGAGRLGRRPGGRARRGRDVERAGRQRPRRRRALAGGRPVRRRPIAPRRHVPAALWRGADAARAPARAAGRDDRLGRWRPPPDRAQRSRGRAARSRTAAAAWPTCSRCPSATSVTRGTTGSARALGWETAA